MTIKITGRAELEVLDFEEMVMDSGTVNTPGITLIILQVGNGESTICTICNEGTTTTGDEGLAYNQNNLAINDKIKAQYLYT